MTELLKALLFGIVEGVTEWLPVSSTGHMILLNELVSLRVSAMFMQMFLVVIQLGAIMAVVILYWNTIWPFRRDAETGKVAIDKETISLWVKIIVACLPAAVVGILADDWLDVHFYNWQVVSVMLILVGIAFIVVENKNAGKKPVIRRLRDITLREALIIGLFQLIAAIFPGTSRSGATVLGGMLIGISRPVAMHGIAFSGMELGILAIGMITSFIVSVLVIRSIMQYIRPHGFKIFGWYRIVLGIVVILFFAVIRR